MVDRGEQLFYDARLSLDGWLSCHSCHTDGHANGLLNDNFGDQSFGAPKRVPSLLGAGRTRPWAWNGSQERLSEQIKKSVHVTMQGVESSLATPDNFAALAAYVRSLPSAPALDEARGNLDPAAVARGRAVFAARECADCHAEPAFTTSATYDVGLSDELGNREFNPPGLRGVSQRSAFFHDGRAGTLRDVFAVHRHAGARRLADGELDDLLAFLRSL